LTDTPVVNENEQKATEDSPNVESDVARQLEDVHITVKTETTTTEVDVPTTEQVTGTVLTLTINNFFFSFFFLF